MIDVMYDWISTHVDLFVVAVFIGSLSFMMTQASILSNQISVREQNREMVNQYREYNQYKDKTLTLADYQTGLASLVGKTRVVINDQSNGQNYTLTYDDTTAPESAYRYDATNSDIVITSELLDVTVDGQPVERWTGGQVGGVFFRIVRR